MIIKKTKTNNQNNSRTNFLISTFMGYSFFMGYNFKLK